MTALHQYCDHNFPAVWDVSSAAYKDTKNKQKKMEASSVRSSYETSVLYALREGFLLIYGFVQIFLSPPLSISSLEIKIRPRHSASSSSKRVPLR